MGEAHTTAAVQQYLDDLADGAPAEPVVRALIARATNRLHVLCASMLVRSYPRLTRPPLNMEADELLGGVVERLLKAMREVRPKHARQFFALVNRHMRWELNDLARRLDERTAVLGPADDLVPSPATSGSVLGPNAKRMLEAIESLPLEEREVFELVRIQGLSGPEVADLLDVSPKTVQRRLLRARMLLAERLADLKPQRLAIDPE